MSRNSDKSHQNSKGDPKYSHIRNDPDFYHFIVRAPNGDTLSPVIERYPDWDLGQAPDLVRARGAILGQITNLAQDAVSVASQSRRVAPNPLQAP